MKMSWNQFNGQFRESFAERQARFRRSRQQAVARQMLESLTNRSASADDAAQAPPPIREEN